MGKRGRTRKSRHYKSFYKFFQKMQSMNHPPEEMKQIVDTLVNVAWADATECWTSTRKNGMFEYDIFNDTRVAYITGDHGNYKMQVTNGLNIKPIPKDYGGRHGAPLVLRCSTCGYLHRGDFSFTDDPNHKPPRLRVTMGCGHRIDFKKLLNPNLNKDKKPKIGAAALTEEDKALLRQIRKSSKR